LTDSVGSGQDSFGGPITKHIFIHI